MCPGKRPLMISSLGFGVVAFFSCTAPRGRGYIFVRCFPVLVSFPCFSPFVSMWRHCKTGAAGSPAARHWCSAGSRWGPFSRRAPGCSCILRAGRGGGWTVAGHRDVQELELPACVMGTLFMIFKSRHFRGWSIFKMHLFG